MAAAPIYLDHQASTPCDPKVVAAMAPLWNEEFANPSSRSHLPGLAAAGQVEQAREVMAASFGVPPESMVFTSGATEANNLAIKGLCEARMARGRHLITVATEHRAVLDPCRYLEKMGFGLTVLPVEADGLLDPARLEAALQPDTVLVSVMAANNEIGVLQPLAAIGALCRSHGAAFHCDAAQLVGHQQLKPLQLGIDLLSCSGHKFYGPKGCGALVVADGIELAAQLHGGGQEGGRRSGSLSTPLVVGLAAALQFALIDASEREQRLALLRDQLWCGLQQLGGIELNGALQPRLAHNLNITVAGVNGTRLHSNLKKRLAVSGGSACSSATGEPSHVLLALGRSRLEAAASVRFGLGRSTTETQISATLEWFSQVLANLR
ncbi:MAG: cysteine desulfurase family protein [Cyanobacteria bacterium]|nr:cysteine desulfurase family protein [Cyanobacteriota bacterium]